MPNRFSENSSGDFYVENEVCTSCGAPEQQAPDLIAHSKFEYGHCYFKKQPETEDEIERAINAISVSCVGGLRYSGKDEKILKRLYEIGLSEQCDHKPVGSYKTIIWTSVEFQYSGSIKELSKLITTQIRLGIAHIEKQIIDFRLDSEQYFEFIYRWTDGKTGNFFKCYSIGDNKFRLEIDIEKDGYEISMRGNAVNINSILRRDNKISKILWFDQEQNTYCETELR